MRKNLEMVLQQLEANGIKLRADKGLISLGNEISRMISFKTGIHCKVKKRLFWGRKTFLVRWTTKIGRQKTISGLQKTISGRRETFLN